ncbi:MAG TPA: mannose-1-phosphate guanylyltransferase/mannose-6-phosphate isomerase [Gammaproteobacteria bacterium]|nr:mannose-1-phosphate guanylyltransferase/mannose-6-phosphate isomerase [Gammaproteobacteria bacterium]
MYPVILSGGAGTRLWPLSREHYPKPLLPLVNDRSLLQETACRLDGLDGVAAPVFVCNEEHRFLLADQVRQLGKTPAAIILEPEGRNTAPALTIAALELSETDPDAVMVVMPADHVIPEGEIFREAVAAGTGLAAQGYLVTFGVVPDRPETGYGYIRRGHPLEGTDAFQVARFVEKPDRATAGKYLAGGDYLWNSGIFAMAAGTWLQELARHCPDILEACRAAWTGMRSDQDFRRVDKAAFLGCPGDSIDYAVMEKTDRAAVVPLNAAWSDVGAWSSLMDVRQRDGAGNVLQGDVLTHDTRNTLVLAQQRCVATVGVEDLVVVETGDAVLVAHRDRAQDVKQIVGQLKDSHREESKVHRRVHRPWGDYEGIDKGGRYQVKRLTVKPGAALSLQMHHHRAEHWVVVTGTARVTRGDEVFLLSENESTYIPIGVSHRLENPGSIPLEIIEVQSGSYLGEDDIVRFEDVYDRCDKQ